MNATLQDGNVITTGDKVLFSQGFKQQGMVIGITDTDCGKILTLVPVCHRTFCGDIIGGHQEASAFAEYCWTR